MVTPAGPRFVLTNVRHVVAGVTDLGRSVAGQRATLRDPSRLEQR
jgi:hypothetical protein